MLWQVTRWGLSINKAVLLLKYTETYVLCISLLYGAEWVICSWLKRIFANSLTENIQRRRRERFWMWPGSDLSCTAAFAPGNIQHIWMIPCETQQRHERREVFLQKHLFLCGQRCWLWQMQLPDEHTVELNFWSSEPLNSSNGTVWFDLIDFIHNLLQVSIFSE